MATQWIKRTAVMLLALLLTMVPAALAGADSGVVTGTTVSGTVRVYLSSIGSKTSVDLSVDGSYSIGGDTSRALARGTQITVKNSGGTLTLIANGQSQSMGSRFKLRRHQTSGENGVRIAQARYPSNLYPGDIEFIAKGGNVQIIVHVYMEDYMRGVLPYEMDNSFPLEALKAQAVAARTYALKKMSAQSSTYDLVDTTSDQVYNGTPAGNARCVQAVQETQGIVGTVGGEYMASYYTASNGGQTESVANAWGSGSYSYLQVKDDPYDLRNGASIAKSVTFYRDGTTSVSALTALLADEAAMQVGAPYVHIEEITSVTPHSPKYGEPSRVYSKIDVGLRLSGYGYVTVTLDYFSQVESLCSMSINVLKNETLTVTQTAGGFKLTARRFGHGVGMSQRGAQQMANEGVSYDQILQFYYPGLTRTRYTMTRTMLPSMDGTVSAPDGPVSDSKAAIVTLSNPLDSLNLRSEASTTSSVLATMPHGTQVTLLEMGSAWSYVQYGTLSGYVKNEYLSVQEDEPQVTPPANASRGTATVALSDESQTLNLRAAPTLSAAVLAHLRHGQTLTVIERYETWTYVQTGTQTGYVMNDYIVYDAEGGAQTQPENTPPPQTDAAMTATVRLQSADSRLNLRESASLSAGVIGRIPSGAVVTVEQWGESWCRVSYGGQSGYCSTDYLSFESSGASSGGSQTPTPMQMVAIVLPFDGLNLRSGPSTASAAIMTLPQGTMLSVMGESVAGMLPVRLGSLMGYVSGEYVYVTELEQPQITPTPTPAPTPTPTPAPATPEPYMGTAMVTAAGGLKLRQEPGTSGATMTTMPLGSTVYITGAMVNGFYPVRYGSLNGYASAQYLNTNLNTTPIPVMTAMPVPHASGPITGRVGSVAAPSGLNLRAEASSSAQVLATLGYGVKVTVTGERVNGFYPVRIGTLSGYVSADYISFDYGASAYEPTPTPSPAVQGGAGIAVGSRVVVSSDNGLNLRAQPNSGSEVVYVLPYGMVLTVIGEPQNGFLYVQWAGYTGYVSAQYVTPFGSL